MSPCGPGTGDAVRVDSQYSEQWEHKANTCIWRAVLRARGQKCPGEKAAGSVLDVVTYTLISSSSQFPQVDISPLNTD